LAGAFDDLPIPLQLRYNSLLLVEWRKGDLNAMGILPVKRRNRRDIISQ
jgi:hypothetical protein